MGQEFAMHSKESLYNNLVISILGKIKTKAEIKPSLLRLTVGALRPLRQGASDSPPRPSVMGSLLQPGLSHEDRSDSISFRTCVLFSAWRATLPC